MGHYFGGYEELDLVRIFNIICYLFFMTFEDIIGQSFLKTHLTQSINSGRIPHAQLYVGKRGVGALALRPLSETLDRIDAIHAVIPNPAP